MRDWAGKLTGAAVRIAGLLHLAQYPADGALQSAEIKRKTMEAAICVGEYLIPPLDKGKAAQELPKADALPADERAIQAGGNNGTASRAADGARIYKGTANCHTPRSRSKTEPHFRRQSLRLSRTERGESRRDRHERC